MTLRVALVLLLLAAGGPAELSLAPTAAVAAEPAAKRCVKKHDHKADAARRSVVAAPRKVADKKAILVIDRSVRQVEILSFGP